MSDMITLQVEAHTVRAALLISRRLAGLSARQVGEKVGVSHTTVIAWESGKSEPSVTQFMRWAEACGQSPTAMLADIQPEDDETPAASATGVPGVVRLEGLEPPTFCFGDRSRDDAGFWSPERSLILAAMWCQVEPDTEIATSYGVAL